MLEKLVKGWKAYRHRFVPWIAFNLKHREKRLVESGQQDKIVDDDVLLSTLLCLLPKLQSVVDTKLPQVDAYKQNMKVMQSVLGFCVERAQSKVPGAGVGVVMTAGSADRGTLIALYPGTVYRPNEPILLPSIGNPFLFRCVDGIYIDGNDRWLSKIIYKSCVSRESVWPGQGGDLTWLTDYPVAPLNVGQYVNNQSPGFPANVAYQELDVPWSSIPPQLRCFLPNVWYRSSFQLDYIRLVALVATSQIHQGDEVFSAYYTLVN